MPSPAVDRADRMLWSEMIRLSYIFLVRSLVLMDMRFHSSPGSHSVALSRYGVVAKMASFCKIYSREADEKLTI